MHLDDFKYAQRERLIFLDRCLTWRGSANRRDLIRRFGISEAQAALDFRAYLDVADFPPAYDSTRKCYIAAKNHQPLIPSSLTESFDVVADGGDEGFLSVLPRPERMADPATVAMLYQAMKSKSALHVIYTSMGSGRDEGQWIAPTRFTSDGESVHVRAFSFKHNEYRNYLPVRISVESSFETKRLEESLPEDIDWNTKAIIWLQPSAGLSQDQAQAVRREFGFERELLRIETRKALEFFITRRWGLDEEGARLEIAKVTYEYMPIS